MRNPFKCRLFGHHDYEMRRAPGSVFLECRHCGRRSKGWNLDQRPVKHIDRRQRLFIADSLDSAHEVSAGEGANVLPAGVLAHLGELRLTFGRRNWL